MRKVGYLEKTECPHCSGLGTFFICISCEGEEIPDKSGQCIDVECYDDIVEVECKTCESTGEIYLREHIDNQH